MPINIDKHESFPPRTRTLGLVFLYGPPPALVDTARVVGSSALWTAEAARQRQDAWGLIREIRAGVAFPLLDYAGVESLAVLKPPDQIMKISYRCVNDG
ncbi:hypothetical protein SRHO_G00293910 [Serrasalmus rhombeus]